jgi:apolipoprotein N-acyltransferase
MASSFEVKRWGIGFAATALLGAGVWFGTGLVPFWPLLWVAPVPLLLWALEERWWAAALAAFAGWYVGGLNLWHYFHVVLGGPTVPALSIPIVGAAIFSLGVSLSRALVRRGGYVAGLLALPSLWVSYEFVLGRMSVHGTALNLAYSQLEFLPFLQLASVTGPWGLSFVLMLVPVSLAIGWHLRRSGRRVAIGIAGGGVGVLAVIALAGVLRLAQPPSAERVRIGLVASDPPVSPEVAEEGEPTARLFAAYGESVLKLAAAGARVVVLPEKLAVATDPDTHRTDAFFQSLADTTGAQIVAGMIRVARRFRYNEARVYTPGRPVLTYDKQHLLPPFESKLEPGTALTLLAQTRGTWGVAICKDMDFTPLSRSYGQAGAGLMLVPAWDFVLDRLLHGHMAILRGVEDGFSVARAAKQGLLTISDDRGHILAEARSDSAPFATLIADVSTTHDTTLYLLWGDWFGWLAVAVLAAVLIALGLRVRAPQAWRPSAKERHKNRKKASESPARRLFSCRDSNPISAIKHATAHAFLLFRFAEHGFTPGDVVNMEPRESA